MPNELRYRAGDYVVAQVLESEAVLLHLGTSTYFRLNGVAACVWESLSRRPRSLVELVDELHARFDVTREQLEYDLESLLRELANATLVTKNVDVATP